MSFKINPILAIALIVGVIVLLVALIKGCHENKGTYAKYKKVDSLNNMLLNVIADDKRVLDSTMKGFHDSLEFVNGQYTLANAQKMRTESELQDAVKENRALIAQHRLHKYADTSAVTVPNGFVTECEGCFVKLEKTTNLAEKYKKDASLLEAKQNNQNQLYQKRFKEIEVERLGFNNKINSLAKKQQEYLDKLKPHGRLYLSWGVLWKPLPWAAGIGAMYQTKRNLIVGAKAYYSASGTLIETNVNFPLSLRFK